MQKKLYFLDEQEKNRILNLHESRTQGQYLLSEQTGEIPYPTDVSKQAVDKILKISAEKKKGGGGSYLAPLQQREIDKEFGQGTYSKFLAANGELVLKGAKKFSSPKSSFVNYKCVTGDIKNSESYSGKKYIDQGANPRLGGINIGYGSVATYYDSGVMFYKVGKERLPVKEDTFYKYSCDGTKIVPTQEVVNIDGKKIGNKAVTSYQKVAGGYVGKAFSDNVVKQLRDTVGITGEGGLGQNDINQLYAKISALPNKQ